MHLMFCVLQTLATLLSAIPLSSKGPAQIIIYDIHALQERFYFSDTVIPRWSIFILPFFLVEANIFLSFH